MAVHARNGQLQHRARRFAPLVGFAPRRPRDAASATSARWGDPLKQRVVFQYDAAHDIVIATPRWNIETAEDVRTWYAQYEAYLKRFRRPMDFIVVLDDFQVATAIGPFWGDHRARLLTEYTRINFRVRTGKGVRFFVHTSGARHNVATQETATVEDAVQAIVEMRQKHGLGRTSEKTRISSPDDLRSEPHSRGGSVGSTGQPSTARRSRAL